MRNLHLILWTGWGSGNGVTSKPYTGGSRLSCTAVKLDSRLAQIFCIISFLYNLINLMQIGTDKPDNW